MRHVMCKLLGPVLHVAAGGPDGSSAAVPVKEAPLLDIKGFSAAAALAVYW